MPKVLMVISRENFRDEEYAKPKEVLESRGAEVITASTDVGECRGTYGMTAHADEVLCEADMSRYDAIVFVGGSGAEVFFDDFCAHEKAAEVHDAFKVVGAICIAPSTLARAGLLNGRRATSFPSREKDLVEHGANYTGEPVTVAGKIVTAKGPQAAWEFGQKVADLMRLPRGDANMEPPKSAGGLLDKWEKLGKE